MCAVSSLSKTRMDAVDTFVGLLLGDVQTRRLLGVMDAPCETDIEGRATRAAEKIP